MTLTSFRSVALAALAWLAGCGDAATATDIPVYGYTVVHVFPHDPQAFTEGLLYEDGFLYESTGEFEGSGVRKVRLDTGEVVQRLDTPTGHFGEGIVFTGNRMAQLTWRDGVGFLYDRKTFKPLGTFHYPGEGWAMTRDAKHVYMSDGTPTIRVLDPVSLAQTGRIEVTADGAPVSMINELEWVKGEIYANLWQTDRIARIDPRTGRVVGWIDLAGLMDKRRLSNLAGDVLNGIAYDAARDRLFVTGKHWPSMFEIRLTPRR